MPSAPIHIIGGGLAGCEAAWQIARAGRRAVLHEMRPVRATQAHKTDRLAELVCSNSLKSEQENTAPWLLKEELRRLDSLLIGAIAPRARVPAGHALTVDREIFADGVTRAMEDDPSIEIRRREIVSLDTPANGDPDAIFIVASGPLTSDGLAEEIARITGSERLYFYDSISPIVDAESIDTSIAFRASRYGKSLDGTADYLNCPLDRAQYEAFLDALLAAESVPAHIEADRLLQQPPADRAEGESKNIGYFEACLPVEEIARRGRDTLRFGPMKPMGLIDPRTGRRPYAVVQLRQENARAGSYNLVGFQNHIRFGEQQRILRMIPGLEQAEFLRFGQVHRNTYINAPALLTATLQLRTRPRIFFAGQISGVEGYVESIATGLVAGRAAAALAAGEIPTPFPRETAVGSLCAYVCGADPANYQPANITFDLLPKLANPPRDKRARQAEVCRRALAALDAYLSTQACHNSGHTMPDDPTEARPPQAEGARAKHTRRQALAALAAAPAVAHAAALSSTPANWTLRQASEQIRAKKISPVELTRACLDRIDKLNPKLNAFITVMTEQAMAQARDLEAEQHAGRWRGPLHGVPIGLKDLYDTAGVKTTCASAVFAGRVPTQDAEVVRRLKAAGAVILGKQNMHEFAYGGTSVASHYGAVHNPWNLERIAGGSSGGSAASVAANLGFGAMGSDTGGSIRGPSTFCGVTGLKPTYGRVSTRGVVPLSWSLDHVGPICRTAEDAALMLEAVAGYDPQEITSVDWPVERYSQTMHAKTASWKLGVVRQLFFEKIDPEVEAAVNAAFDVLRKLTAGVADVELPVNVRGILGRNLPVVPVEAYAFHEPYVTKTPELYQASTLARIKGGIGISAPAYAEGRRELDRLRRGISDVFTSVDMLATPTAPMVAVRIEDAAKEDVPPPGGVSPLLRNTQPFDLFGLPTISIPCGFSRNGMPIGLQISGPRFAEGRVLALAHAYQQATDWHLRQPPV